MNDTMGMWMCDNGYVDFQGRCRRCPIGMQKMDGKCIPCMPGFECFGGPEVNACDLGKYSPGNRTSCLQCTECRQITVTRCNLTQDSVCSTTKAPLALITIHQEFRSEVDGETFAMFAMIYASSLPKARLLRVCGESVCIDCFQGICPIQRMKSRLLGPSYQLAIEIRFEARRLVHNMEMLTKTAFLSETAKTTMSKLTDIPFVALSRVESTVPSRLAGWGSG